MRIAGGIWRRAAVVLGVVIALLAVFIGFGLEHITGTATGAQALPPGASGSSLAKYISDHQSDFNSALVLEGVLALLLLCFVVSLHEHLSTTGRPGAFGQIMIAASVVTASVLLAAHIASWAMVNVTPRDDIQSIRLLWQFAWGMEATVTLPLGLLMLAAGAAIWRSNALPRWVAVFSVVLGGLELTAEVANGGLGPIAAALWTLVLSGTLLVERKRATRTADPELATHSA